MVEGPVWIGVGFLASFGNFLDTFFAVFFDKFSIGTTPVAICGDGVTYISTLLGFNMSILFLLGGFFVTMIPL